MFEAEFPSYSVYIDVDAESNLIPPYIIITEDGYNQDGMLSGTYCITGFRLNFFMLTIYKNASYLGDAKDEISDNIEKIVNDLDIGLYNVSLFRTDFSSEKLAYAAEGEIVIN